MTNYTTDGRCHNTNRGTFGHECGKPARWIGITSRGFRSGYCDVCKNIGDEGLCCVTWEEIVPLPNGWTWERVEEERAKWDIKAHMVPIAAAPGVVAWGTINSVRMEG